MLSRFAFLSGLASALLLAGCGQQAEQTDASSVPVPPSSVITVMAAASLTDALTEVARDYEARTGAQVRLSFASSSTLARQIEAGAPADVFASADRRWMDYLRERNLVNEASVTEPIGNSVVLVAPADAALSPVTIDAALDLPGLLGPDGRLAVGDPAHVPAGAYAQEALEHLGLWRAIEPRLARADDVRSALALVARGEAPLGIVYGTDAAITPDVAIIGVFPADSHQPVVYPFALTADAQPGAQDFLDHATGDDAQAIYQKYGFTPR